MTKNNITLEMATLLGFETIKDYYVSLGMEELVKIIKENPELKNNKDFTDAAREVTIENLKGQTVMSSQETSGATDNNKGGKMEGKVKETKAGQTKGGEKDMKQKTKTETKGGVKMKKEKTVGGTKMEKAYKFTALEKVGYLQGLGILAKHFGKEGLYEVEKFGVKLVALSIKEKARLKDAGKRLIWLFGTQLVKEQLENDFVNLMLDLVQAYHTAVLVYDGYQLFVNFNKVTLKDVEALNAMIDEIYAEEMEDEDEEVDENY